MDLTAFWRGRRVLVTGHTGFKGAWLCLWLEKLGAEVSAVALAPDTSPSLYHLLAPWKNRQHRIQDIRSLAQLRETFAATDPEIVIHMAAQALVRPSYDDPVETFATNVMGTVNVLEAAKPCPAVRVILVVTSDKIYANDGRGRPFGEADPLGGNDPYSASKACAELVCHSYRASFFRGSHVRLATARAGNVIGGGDWSKDRLVPDFMRACEAGEPIALRYPNAVRPWQHVLEPLGGYLMFAEALAKTSDDSLPPALNFGPGDQSSATVSDIANALGKADGDGEHWRQAPGAHAGEAAVLKLDSALATRTLGWRPRLSLKDALAWTTDWYRAHRTGADMRAFSLGQIEAYEERRIAEHTAPPVSA
ncbi:CDP-glucose 4,6-dehydratase [Hyphomicrobium nitrativorans NL23]|uniref:CDP-glucose 4,6-dehydratase n=1 Tax=Hyphomicrobium nitrativorans NL23 TaxID=1029756 RepID=V5SBG1_9HYPH|nr:CDP-glucose 4,6-dehydratase [Hyphomicrobium nitrativorans]AHB47812.1 CDP-glucose 4,6-dehydratase [Hyphomicrobium nitrativorans NL23]